MRSIWRSTRNTTGCRLRSTGRSTKSGGSATARAGPSKCTAATWRSALSSSPRASTRFHVCHPGRGTETFGGTIVHSADYRNGEPYAGMRVLVVGIGNSGAEIAADLVESGAARVAIAVRTSPPITSREILGIPVQLLGILLAPFPPKLVDRLGAALRRFSNGDLSVYGIGAEAWGPFTARRPPVIDGGFLAQLRSRKIDVLPDPSRLTERGVVFADGRTEEFDAIVAATGFTSGLDKLLDSREALDERAFPRSSDPLPGLFFIGYNETPRGALFEANRDARRLARRVELYLRRGPR